MGPTANFKRPYRMKTAGNIVYNYLGHNRNLKTFGIGAIEANMIHTFLNWLEKT